MLQPDAGGRTDGVRIMTIRALNSVKEEQDVRVISDFGDEGQPAVEIGGCVTIHEKMVEVKTIAGQKRSTVWMVSYPVGPVEDPDVQEDEYPLPSLAVKAAVLKFVEWRINNALGW